MVESHESRVRKLESKHGAGTEAVTFSVFLVDVEEDGGVYRTQYPNGKRKKIDGSKLGIEPVLNIEPPTAVPIKAKEPPVSVATPVPSTDSNPEPEPVAGDGNNHQRPGESDEHYIMRIRAQGEELLRQFDALR